MSAQDFLLENGDWYKGEPNSLPKHTETLELLTASDSGTPVVVASHSLALMSILKSIEGDGNLKGINLLPRDVMKKFSRTGNALLTEPLTFKQYKGQLSA
jgi:hypothetical protein